MGVTRWSRPSPTFRKRNVIERLREVSSSQIHSSLLFEGHVLMSEAALGKSYDADRVSNVLHTSPKQG
jgi:hypothetical protein